MQKTRYELDPYNRLIVKSRKTGGLQKFRQVLDGRFRTGKNNGLSYYIKAPLDGKIPHQVKFKGQWSLTGNHDLRLTVDKLSRETLGRQITLQGEILDVKANSLLYAVTTRTKEGGQSTYVLNLKGSWKADKHNRLLFYIKKEESNYDILTFKGVWEINKNHEIIYEYEKAELVRKKRKTRALTFKGFWDIKDKARISYLLGRDTDSAFQFKASAAILKERYIRYEAGINLKQKLKPAKKTITLFGRWKVKKNAGLVFEVEYENKKIHDITFGAEAKLTDKDTVLFKLKKDFENKDIGIKVELSRKILKGAGEAFIRALKSNRESAVYLGAAHRW